MESLNITLLLLLGLVFGLFCSFIAKQKNKDILAWFFLGFFFSLIALLALIAVPKIEESEYAKEFTCKSCGITVKTNVKFCPFCGESFEDEKDKNNRTKFCSNCGKDLTDKFFGD